MQSDAVAIATSQNREGIDKSKHVRPARLDLRSQPRQPDRRAVLSGTGDELVHPLQVGRACAERKFTSLMRGCEDAVLDDHESQDVRHLDAVGAALCCRIKYSTRPAQHSIVMIFRLSSAFTTSAVTTNDVEDVEHTRLAFTGFDGWLRLTGHDYHSATSRPKCAGRMRSDVPRSTFKQLSSFRSMLLHGRCEDVV